MGEFNELIRNFDKIRDYMRDFYIYGFKSRSDFQHKSKRTYDNEKRRIESYMGEYMKWHYTKNGKHAFISMDCARIKQNPLFAAWKSKTFTANDIMLHFYILDILNDRENLTVDELTDAVCSQSGRMFDVQLVRLKCREYAKNGLLIAGKKGKAICYSRSTLTFDRLEALAPGLAEAIQFYQGAAPFGEIGSFLLDSGNKENTIFSYKHYYVAHTLEDGVLLNLLKAMENNKMVAFKSYNESGNWITALEGVPLKIFISPTTGRRYVCMHKPKSGRFFNYRLDHIKSVQEIGIWEQAPLFRRKLESHLDYVWTTSFSGKNRMERFTMKLYIDEVKEKYVLERMKREGHGGTLERVDTNTFLYTKDVYDATDAVPWVKTFMIELNSTNAHFTGRFYQDVEKMRDMYEA